MESWDDLYQREGIILTEPSKHVIELVDLLKEQGVERLLDHCCGTGRHVKYLADQGFYVVGLDNSQEAIAQAQELCMDIENCQLLCSDMASIPFRDQYFDAVLSLHGIQFGTKPQRAGAFTEITRTLKGGGYFYFSTLSRNHIMYGKGTLVEDDPHTFIEIPGLHIGYRHFFDEVELDKCLEKFELIAMDEYRVKPAPESFFVQELCEWRVLARKK